MTQQAVGDVVDLDLHLLVARHESGDRLGAAEKAFPPGAAAVRVEFGEREAAQGGDDLAQVVAGQADVLVAHVGQHRLADALQLALGAGAEGDDGLGVGHVDLGHAAVDLGGGFGGRVAAVGHGIADITQPRAPEFVHQRLRFGGFGAHLVRHHSSFLCVVTPSRASRSRSTPISTSRSVRDSAMSRRVRSAKVWSRSSSSAT